MLFELVGGRATTPLFIALTAEPAARARLQALMISEATVTVLIDYTGPEHAIARLRRVIRGPPQPCVIDYDTLHDSDKRLRFVVTWTRPRHPEHGVSLEHLLHDTVGPGGLLFGRIERGVIAYKAAAPEGRGLSEFVAAVQEGFGARFTVRALRLGPFRPGWEVDETSHRVDPDEHALLATALAAGYYDEPKRCGVRELGDALGLSKSVIARRLRDLERRALENLVG